MLAKLKRFKLGIGDWGLGIGGWGGGRWGHPPSPPPPPPTHQSRLPNPHLNFIQNLNIILNKTFVYLIYLIKKIINKFFI